MKTLLPLSLGLIFGLTLGNTFRSIEARKSLKRIEAKIDALSPTAPEAKRLTHPHHESQNKE